MYVLNFFHRIRILYISKKNLKNIVMELTILYHFIFYNKSQSVFSFFTNIILFSLFCSCYLGRDFFFFFGFCFGWYELCFISMITKLTENKYLSPRFRTTIIQIYDVFWFYTQSLNALKLVITNSTYMVYVNVYYSEQRWKNGLHGVQLNHGYFMSFYLQI